MTTKHEQIIEYIEKLPINHKISVRSIARNLGVSEGTAYRAIKEAENRQLVATKERVGTVRIESYDVRRLKHLTVEEIVNVTNCIVHGGRDGLDHEVKRFIIGAMQEDDMIQYMSPQSLIIVGNREEAQRIAIEHDVAVLITGGFTPSPENIAYANEKNVPLMSVNFDTYGTATLINKAMIERAMQKDILLVEDIYIPIDGTHYLTDQSVKKDYRRLNEQTGHTRFPVINQSGRIIGIVTAKDLFDYQANDLVTAGMTSHPIVATKQMSVASVTHMMIWDGLELLPVVDDTQHLIGILSRQDVLRTLQYTRQEEQSDNRIEHLLAQKLKPISLDKNKRHGRYRFVSDVTLTDHVGGLSNSLLSAIIQLTVEQFVRETKYQTVVVDNISTYFMKLIPLQSTLDVHAEYLEAGRRNLKVEVTIYHGQTIMTKAIVTANSLNIQ